MIEIKFRALLADNKGNSEWFYYGVREIPKFPIKYPFIKAQDLQYTGLKDRTGKEIYEGDITNSDIPDRKLIVKFCKTKGVIGFGLVRDIKDENGCSIITERTEIIGNIYENPELLKEDVPASASASTGVRGVEG